MMVIVPVTMCPMRLGVEVHDPFLMGCDNFAQVVACWKCQSAMRRWMLKVVSAFKPSPLSSQ
jgi:hypothetical protein